MKLNRHNFLSLKRPYTLTVKVIKTDLDILKKYPGSVNNFRIKFILFF